MQGPQKPHFLRHANRRAKRPSGLVRAETGTPGGVCCHGPPWGAHGAPGGAPWDSRPSPGPQEARKLSFVHSGLPDHAKGPAIRAPETLTDYAKGPAYLLTTTESIIPVGPRRPIFFHKGESQRPVDIFRPALS